VRGFVHGPTYREQVFRIWLHNDQNCTRTADIASKKLKLKVSTVTVTRWRDQYDWEAKAAVYNNELQRMLRLSDDPVLKQLAMDDLETSRVLAAIQKIMREVIRQPRKYGMMPRNINDVVKLMSYARDERERILKKGTPQAVTPQNPNLTYYDQRKIELRTDFDQLPPDAQRTVVGQLSQVLGQNSKSLRRARTDAFADEIADEAPDASDS